LNVILNCRPQTTSQWETYADGTTKYLGYFFAYLADEKDKEKASDKLVALVGIDKSGSDRQRRGKIVLVVKKEYQVSDKPRQSHRLLAEVSYRSRIMERKSLSGCRSNFLLS
jgi:hypothetical protein